MRLRAPRESAARSSLRRLLVHACDLFVVLVVLVGAHAYSTPASATAAAHAPVPAAASAAASAATTSPTTAAPHAMAQAPAAAGCEQRAECPATTRVAARARPVHLPSARTKVVQVARAVSAAGAGPSAPLDPQERRLRALLALHQAPTARTEAQLRRTLTRMDDVLAGMRCRVHHARQRLHPAQGHGSQPGVRASHAPLASEQRAPVRSLAAAWTARGPAGAAPCSRRRLAPRPAHAQAVPEAPGLRARTHLDPP